MEKANRAGTKPIDAWEKRHIATMKRIDRRLAATAKLLNRAAILNREIRKLIADR